MLGVEDVIVLPRLSSKPAEGAADVVIFYQITIGHIDVVLNSIGFHVGQVVGLGSPQPGEREFRIRRNRPDLLYVACRYVDSDDTVYQRGNSYGDLCLSRRAGRGINEFAIRFSMELAVNPC